MKTSVIIAAGGSGKRLKSKTEKPYVLINRKPLLVYTVKAVLRCKDISEIIIVVSKDHIQRTKKIIKKYKLKKIAAVVAGGSTRTRSVENGLKEVCSTSEIVSVHDGARPLIKADIFSKAITAAKKYGSSCVCVKVKSTIKCVKKDRVVSTVDRSFLWEAQTPQAFKKELFEKAYKKMKKGRKYTDDVSLLENMQNYTRVVEGHYDNIKITTKEDLDLAKRMLK